MKNELRYPKDNSFSFCLEDGTINHRLAGTYNTEAKQVKVVSKPFKGEDYYEY